VKSTIVVVALAMMVAASSSMASPTRMELAEFAATIALYKQRCGPVTSSIQNIANGFEAQLNFEEKLASITEVMRKATHFLGIEDKKPDQRREDWEPWCNLIRGKLLTEDVRTVRAENVPDAAYPELFRGSEGYLHGCTDPSDALTYLYIARGSPHEVQSGIRKIIERDSKWDVGKKLAGFIRFKSRRFAPDSVKGRQVVECLRFNTGDRVVVDTVRDYPGTRLACVRHRSDEGDSYQGDCRWLPEAVLVP
jgi:hypothetical protein